MLDPFQYFRVHKGVQHNTHDEIMFFPGLVITLDRVLAHREETPMLCLSRKVGEKIVIDGCIVVEVTKVSGNRVTIAIKAPENVRILRGEIADTDNGTGSKEEVPAA